MKKVFISLAIAISVVCSSSCNVLDWYPHNAVSRENVSAEDLDLLYVGLYNYAQYKPTFEGYFIQDALSCDMTRGGGSTYATPQLWIKDLLYPSVGWANTPFKGYYAWLYQVNSFIRLAESANQTTHVVEMNAVAHYFRALIYYNLVTKYRCVPVLRENTGAAVATDTEEEGWKLVNEDLTYAIANGPAYTTKNYVSVQAAKALYARALIAQGKKSEAAALSEELINDPQFALADFDQIFRGGTNKEEIFTLLNNKEENGLSLGGNYISTIYVLTSDAVALFNSDDKRGPVTYTQYSGGNVLYKWPTRDGCDPINISRLGEMYLISAEGLGISGGGLKRLNELRSFRGLPSVTPSPTTDAQLLDAVIAERRLELFGEGFRWYDLVRTGKYCSFSGLEEKYTVIPIPQTEIDLNPNLKQHPLWQ